MTSIEFALAKGCQSAFGHSRPFDLMSPNVCFGSKADIGRCFASGYSFEMARTQQTFENGIDEPIYVSIEPWPECFELEPGDKLTLVWNAPETGDAAEVHFVGERNLVVWPNGSLDNIQFLFNGEPGKHRSWQFKHQ